MTIELVAFGCYHGTSAASADALLTNGWKPRTHSFEWAGNGGNSAPLYLTDDPENAAWYAARRGSGVMLAVAVTPELVAVDPEDGIGDTVAAERSHTTPASLVCTGPLPAAAFRRLLG